MLDVNSQSDLLCQNWRSISYVGAHLIHRVTASVVAGKTRVFTLAVCLLRCCSTSSICLHGVCSLNVEFLFMINSFLNFILQKNVTKMSLSPHAAAKMFKKYIYSFSCLSSRFSLDIETIVEGVSFVWCCWYNVNMTSTKSAKKKRKIFASLLHAKGKRPIDGHIDIIAAK